MVPCGTVGAHTTVFCAKHPSRNVFLINYVSMPMCQFYLLLFALVVAISAGSFNPPDNYSDIDFASHTSTYGFRIIGANAGDNLCHSVSSAGDFNADGVDDIIIGGRYEDSSGYAYVIYGMDNENDRADVNMSIFAAGPQGFRILGSYINGTTGYAVSGLGDANGDGVDDIVIGSPSATVLTRSEAGAVHVVFGSSQERTADLDLSTFTAGPTTGFSIFGANLVVSSVGDNLGVDVAGLDFNGDGIQDVVIGANRESLSGLSEAGAVYVIFGHNGSQTPIVDIDLANFTSGAAGFKILAANVADRLGVSVSSAGDFNGDGAEDILVGANTLNANGKNNAGGAYVLFGNRTIVDYVDIDLAAFSSGAGGFIILGEYANSYTGYDVARAGDFNGDGIDDILVSSYLASSLGREFSGDVFVLFGNDSGLPFDTIDLGLFRSGWTGFRLTGAGDRERFGFSIDSAGDFNADGYSDLVIGSYYADVHRGNSGTVLVYFGHGGSSSSSSYPHVDTRNITSGPAGFFMYGSGINEFLGRSVAGVGDVNNDGFADIVAGTPYGDPFGKTAAGICYVVFGSGYHRPTSQPSSTPSSAPTSVPTWSPAVRAVVTSSPSYAVSNGFAFAVRSTITGRVHTWGEAAYGGNSSAVQNAIFANVSQVSSTRFAYMALKNNGSSVVAWGVESSTRGAAVESSFTNTTLGNLIGNEGAFATIDTVIGRVITFGSKYHGGVVENEVFAPQLSSNVVSLAASAASFTAVKADGTVYAWGSRHTGAAGVSSESNPLLGNVKLVVAGVSAFAALLQSGAVVTWGAKLVGGDSSGVANQLSSDVVHVISSGSAFVAFKRDTSIVTWGYSKWGGDSSGVAAAVSSGVRFVAHTATAFAALKADGSVVAWGKADSGGDTSGVTPYLQNITSIQANTKAFAAINSEGGVIAWGKSNAGGVIPASKTALLSSGVLSITSSSRAFAALKVDGSVVAWGSEAAGGDTGTVAGTHLTSGVHTLCANDVAFSALKSDGTVVVWGHQVSVPEPGLLLGTFSDLSSIGVQCA